MNEYTETITTNTGMSYNSSLGVNLDSSLGMNQNSPLGMSEVTFPAIDLNSDTYYNGYPWWSPYPSHPTWIVPAPPTFIPTVWPVAPSNPSITITTVPVGWQCPVCKSVMAPLEKTCLHCTPKAP